MAPSIHHRRCRFQPTQVIPHQVYLNQPSSSSSLYFQGTLPTTFLQQDDVFILGEFGYPSHFNSTAPTFLQQYEDTLILDASSSSSLSTSQERIITDDLKKDKILKHLRIREVAADGVGEKTICVVCQDNVETGDQIGILPCKHEYHVHCILEWLQQNNTCPLCKLVPFPD